MDDEPITLKHIGWTIVFGLLLGLLVNAFVLVASSFARDNASRVVPAVFLGCVALVLMVRYLPWWAEWFAWW
jgi:hypothetical protein